MPARKRAIAEVEFPEGPAPVSPEVRKLRNMWEFASLMQYIYLFGECVKINQDIDIDVRNMQNRPYRKRADTDSDARNGMFQSHPIGPLASDRAGIIEKCFISSRLDVRCPPTLIA